MRDGYLLSGAVMALGLVGTLSAQAPRSQWDRVYSEAQATRGELLYAENCSMCHGREMAGTVLAPALAGPAFTGKWKGKPLARVYEIMQTRMPLNLSGHLGPEQNAEVLALMLRKGQAAAGPTDLPSSLKTLEGITVLERKP